MQDSNVYSIGYTAFKIENFINVLKHYNIKCIVDVRSNPVSQFYEDYNKNILEIKLKENGIIYRNYAKEFGARQDNKSFYSKEGYLDFNKFICSEQFIDGVEKIKKGIVKGYVFCLMCAETDPINCHRSIMVGRGFYQNGIVVNHILKDKSIQSQDEIEKKMLDIYFKDRNQLTMFSEMKSDEEMIQESYNLKNKEIGYRKNDE